MKFDDLDSSRLTVWFAQFASKARIFKYGILGTNDIEDPVLTDPLQKSLAKNLDRGGLRQFAREESF
jgi:hypothetical protein